MLKVKICGLRDPQNIEEIASLVPDFMGFIFYERSPRYVGLKLNTVQLQHFDSRIKKVGVFVNQTVEFILDKKDAYFLDAVQLHGEESPDLCRELCARVPGLPLIKAFGIRTGFDFNQTAAYEPFCTWFLFDTASFELGGSGVPFDWSLLSGYRGHNPFLVGGGLGRDNVRGLLAAMRGHDKFVGVDINSKVEVRPGLKSISLVKDVLAEVRK